MCLTIPKQIISINKDVVKLKNPKSVEIAHLLSFPRKRESKKLLKDIDSRFRGNDNKNILNIKKGDWVLTQNMVRHGSPQNVIIKKIKEKQAKEILKIINNHLI
jgi:hydrogenase maturation factor